ncbi:MAG: hypothetical protein GY854_02390 [Deltaproteobacteria bacterium]|nr:hypothetical protein [Deltaproteobacteria bacterium]
MSEQEVLERIQEALDKGSTRLDLPRNKLKELPPEIGQLTNLTALDLSYTQLTEIPPEIGQLSKLTVLYLHNNPLTELPTDVGKLSNLTRLNLSRNQLTELPAEIGQLSKLTELYLSDNQLTEIPPDIAPLSNLTTLDLSYTQLTEIPPEIGQLANLTALYLHGNQLTEIPTEIGQLANLTVLGLSRNQLTEIPTEIGQLTNLTELDLGRNPLTPELAAANEDGVDSVKAYLRELGKGAKKRFEAKLLILGDGNEGKTCVSRALRGLKFKPQVTTHGVDVDQWEFPHPDVPEDKEKAITLNIWDFEGQEINHQTHQFFLTTDSLYLLVFKGRDEFRLDRAEYWLDTIRARAPKAQVVLVITECEGRTPYIPEDKLQENYSDLLADGKWLFAVGCETDKGIPELQESLIRSAADLHLMGRDWPASYDRAESNIRGQADSEMPHIDRAELHDIFAKASIDETRFNEAASSLAALGIITQFSDCPDLRDFIVLQPQWLTKAISKIMEDSELKDEKGKIPQQRMQEIWDDEGYEQMFTTFHNCMKEFELCYDLDDHERNCLVPLRFGFRKPEIPWTPGRNLKRRRVNYKLNTHPPMGLMSRLIVKTHHMIVTTEDCPNGVYWHNGVFLRTGEGSFCSEALCEFDSGERTLSVTVQAAFPQNMIEQIHAYIKAVFSFFAGLKPERSYGCIRVDSNAKTESQCHGLHSENRITYALEIKEKVACEHGRHQVDPIRLISGISSFSESDRIREIIRRELDITPTWVEPIIQNFSTLLDWANQNNQLLDQVLQGQEELEAELKQEMEQKLREYLGYFGQMLDNRDVTSAPGIISINTIDRSAWNPKKYFEKKFVLTPYCECHNNIHPCEDGGVEFSKDRDWWKTTAPWITRVTKVLSVGLQLAFAGMPLAMSAAAFAAIKNDVAFMNALTKHIELNAGDADKRTESIAGRFGDDTVADMRRDDGEVRLMRAALSGFLKEVAPDNYKARQWGSLRRVRMSDNSYRWICESCYRKA